jgi:hypothetical protein
MVRTGTQKEVVARVDSRNLSAMIDRRIEQAVLIGTKCVGHSPGFDDALIAAAVQLAGKYGELPRGQRALLVQRLGAYVAVISIVHKQVQTFTIFLLSPKLYRAIHDPFRIAAEFQPATSPSGELPSLQWSAGSPPPRTLANVQAVLQSGDSATLLGAAQAIVDGGRVAFTRPSSDAETLQRIWSLLPDSVRAETTLATFAPNNALGFDLVATPCVEGPDFAGYLTEEQAGDYPEGRYELALQLAAETNDADAIDRLFARRSMSQAVRLAITLLISTIVLGLAARYIPWERLR